MNLTKKIVIALLAGQYAWYMRRFGRGEKARDNLEMATGFTVVFPAMLATLTLVSPLLVVVKLKHLYLIGGPLLLVSWFLVDRYVDGLLKTEYDNIHAAAVDIFEDAARGPSWALRRQLLVGLGVLLVFGAAVVLTRVAAVRFDLVANPEQFQGLADLSKFHRKNESALDDFTDRFEQDAGFVEIACGDSWMQMREVTSDHFEPMTIEYRDLYAPLCRFSPQVSAQRTSRGIRFPQYFYEYGHLFMNVFLERRRKSFDFDQECDSEALTESSGRCDVPLNSSWTVTYTWEPFCKEGMGADVGCE